MKKAIVISRLFLILLLGTVCFQTVHSYTHIAEQMNVTQCHHTNDDSQKQITHAHHHANDCTVCFYSVSHFITSKTTFCDTHWVVQSPKKSSNFFTHLEEAYSFSWFLLRAPPVA